MRIIKKDPDPIVVKLIICGNCGVTLEYVPNDIQKETSRDISGCYDTNHFLTCMNCSRKIYVRR